MSSATSIYLHFETLKVPVDRVINSVLSAFTESFWVFPNQLLLFRLLPVLVCFFKVSKMAAVVLR